jgi:hypothetical protein
MTKRTIKFVEDCYYNGELAHKLGDILSIEDTLGYALRWVVQGKAELLDNAPLEPEKIVNKVEISENKKSKKNLNEGK